jgi:hypothetical protein
MTNARRSERYSLLAMPGDVVRPTDNRDLHMVVLEKRIRIEGTVYLCSYWLDGKLIDEIFPEWRLEDVA